MISRSLGAVLGALLSPLEHWPFPGDTTSLIPTRAHAPAYKLSKVAIEWLVSAVKVLVS